MPEYISTGFFSHNIHHDERYEAVALTFMTLSDQPGAAESGKGCWVRLGVGLVIDQSEKWPVQVQCPIEMI